MYLLYADESGDTGLIGSPTRYFALSGFVVHELRWHETLEAIINFRKNLKAKYGIRLDEELHASVFLHRPAEFKRIAKSMRLRALRDCIDFQKELPDINLINIIVDKNNKPTGYDVFDAAWRTLIQRFNNTISYRNFPGPQNAQDLGVMIADHGDERRLRVLMRKMRRYNPIPNMRGSGYRDMPLKTIIEDAILRNSFHSYFIQLVDINVYFLHQRFEACNYIKTKGANNYFVRLDPILCKVACHSDPLGIVKI